MTRSDEIIKSMVVLWLLSAIITALGLARENSDLAMLFSVPATALTCDIFLTVFAERGRPVYKLLLARRNAK